ncbi:Beta-carotene hydroxylase 1 protein [Thalictrum thalictroides]|uniref:beta-carotene 3-hydroxylase n=1 Tax=Thalictrum thalictroides TaxID=46969 RepID=A0A7J6VJV3_THATH|nr:Beta-carotene hydroxylase 1 protein [Thalictrum thalictroides]
MATGISISSSTRTHRFRRNPILDSKPNILNTPSFLKYSHISTSLLRIFSLRKNVCLTICYVVERRRKQGSSSTTQIHEDNMEERLEHMDLSVKKKLEHYTYLIPTVMFSLGIFSVAVLPIYYRFSWQMQGGDIPITEIFGIVAFSLGIAVSMEFISRWTHRVIWHASLWHIHESHHKPREGRFELNDVFAIINAVPAIGLINFGFFHKGFIPALCLGAGLGLTWLGMAYIFVHNGLVHRRFPVGSIANIPYLRRVAAAHRIHHSAKFEGVPYGLFLGPKELEDVGGTEELEKEINRQIKRMSGS